MLYEDADSTLLRLFECFMEAAPQLCLQLYIMASTGLNETEWYLGKYAVQHISFVTKCHLLSDLMSASELTPARVLAIYTRIILQIVCTTFLATYQFGRVSFGVYQ